MLLLLLSCAQVRNESGQLVLAGPRKGVEEGSMYKRWAKHNKAAIMATGTCVCVCFVLTHMR